MVEAAACPLYVDCDGTLVATDLLKECLAREVVGRPWALPLLLTVALRGRAALKHHLAQRQDIDASRLPYREDLVALLRAERAAGRRLVLATACDRRHADAVAAHLGCFDAVLASDQTRNLKGQAKLAAIRADAGGPFAYVGDASADLPIWAAAQEAWVVGQGALVSAAQHVAPNARIIAPAPRRPLAWLRALRPHQWTKNLLLVVPFVLAHRIGDGAGWLALAVAIAAISMVASGIYILNDVVDIERDRAHRSKHKRPLAAAQIGVIPAVALALGLVIAGPALAALLLPGPFTAWLGIYLTVTVAYSAGLKHVPVVDVLVLAGLYALRMIAGAAAVDVAISQWLLALSVFLFTSLALCKRYTELAPLLDHHGSDARARGYRAADLPVLESAGVGSGLIAVMVLALFIHSADVGRFYQAPWALWLICPLLLYWILRVWFKSARGEMEDDPVVFALRDRPSLVVAVLVMALVIIAARNPFPGLAWLVPGHG